MRIRYRIVLAVLASLGAVTAPVALDLPPAGSTGYCLTEMDGGELVRVPITVLGELGAAAPDGELLLIRLEGDRFGHTGIAAGMSGSPVYVGGELVGALAYGWNFAKEPIAGVTPFAHMRSLSTPSTLPADAAPIAARPDLGVLAAAWRDGTVGERLLAWLLPARETTVGHLPLAVSAAPTPGGGPWLVEGWRRLGWVAGVGAATTATSPARGLVPGGMVAGLLVQGDVSLSVGGTVTAVEGDQIWAFGHPFLGGGSVRLPLAHAGVVAVLPSFGSSFKFFSVGPVVGAFETDRQHGVYGRLGETARMVPVRVEAGGRWWSYQAVDHPTLLPLLAAYLTNASHGAYGRTFGEQTVAVDAELEFAGGARARVRESFAAADAPARGAALVAALVGYFEASPFAPPAIERVTVRLQAQEGIASAEIVDAVPERRVVRAGEELVVRVRLRERHGRETIERLVLTVPAYLRPGTLDLVVAEGSAWTQYDLGARPAPPGSFRDDLRLVERLTPSTTLVAVLEDAGPGVVLPGGAVAAPPSVALGLAVSMGGNMQTTSHRVLVRRDLEIGRPMTGAVRVSLRVRNGEEPAAEATGKESS